MAACVAAATPDATSVHRGKYVIGRGAWSSLWSYSNSSSIYYVSSLLPPALVWSDIVPLLHLINNFPIHTQKSQPFAQNHLQPFIFLCSIKQDKLNCMNCDIEVSCKICHHLDIANFITSENDTLKKMVRIQLDDATRREGRTTCCYRYGVNLSLCLVSFMI